MQAPILGSDPHSCPFENKLSMRTVASKLITQAPAQLPMPAPSPLPPAPPAPADTTAPAIGLTGAAAQRVLRQRGVLVTVGCPVEACTGTARGKVVVGGSAKVFKLKPATEQIAKGAEVTLKLKLGQRALTPIKRALRRGTRVAPS